MSKFGYVDYKQFEKLQQRLNKIDESKRKNICKNIANEAGQILYSKTKKNTPVGIYPKSTGKVGGTLRRNWATEIHELDNGYEVEIFNPTEYAVYVEYGHRTRNHKGWVEGRYMLTNAEIEVEKHLLKISKRHIKKAFEEIFNAE